MHCRWKVADDSWRGVRQIQAQPHDDTELVAFIVYVRPESPIAELLEIRLPASECEARRSSTFDGGVIDEYAHAENKDSVDDGDGENDLPVGQLPAQVHGFGK